MFAKIFVTQSRLVYPSRSTHFLFRVVQLRFASSQNGFVQIKEEKQMKDLDKVYASRVAEEYAPKKEKKALQLKKLDEKAKRPARIFAYSFGAVAALLFGLGMCIVMTDFGPNGTLGVVLGIITGVIGLILCGVNYVLYVKILNSRKQKYAFDIVKLAEEITKGE